jgi:hypothetical protein
MVPRGGRAERGGLRARPRPLVSARTLVGRISMTADRRPLGRFECDAVLQQWCEAVAYGGGAHRVTLGKDAESRAPTGHRPEVLAQYLLN